MYQLKKSDKIKYSTRNVIYIYIYIRKKTKRFQLSSKKFIRHNNTNSSRIILIILLIIKIIISSSNIETVVVESIKQGDSILFSYAWGEGGG